MMPIDVEFLKKRLASGITFYLGARLNREASERFARKYAKEHGDLVVGLGGAVLTEFLKGNVPREYRTYVEDVVDAMADYGMYREIKILAEKEPVCWAQDANTIVCRNFEDLENAKVYIDGQLKTSGTDYTVSGDQIQLKNPLSSGSHDLVVVDGTGKKAFHGKIYA